MKRMLLLLIATSCFCAWADDFTTINGGVYQDVTVVSATPEYLLIIHRGGGGQVLFKDLAVDALSDELARTVQRELRSYAIAAKRQEQVELGRAAAAVAQAEQQERVASRTDRALVLEQKRLQLARDRAALEKDQLELEAAQRRMEIQPQPVIVYENVAPSRKYCGCVGACRHKNKRPSKPTPSQPVKSDRRPNSIIYETENNPYISFDNVDAYNRGPLNR